MLIEIDADVPLPLLSTDEQITAFICRHPRRGRPALIDRTRKFVADCGTKLIVELTAANRIASMELEYPCKHGAKCPACLDRMQKTRILIESGK